MIKGQGVLDTGSRATLRRFALRLIFLVAMAVVGRAGGLVTLGLLALWFAIICSMMAMVSRELFTFQSLNHWDEAMLFLLVHFGARLLEGS